MVMNLSRLLFGVGLGLVLAGQPLHAQQSEADRQAMAQLRANAEKGDAAAQCELGLAYRGKGLPKDLPEAVKWLRKAAEQGNTLAQSNLGYLYAMGEGLPKDPAEAVKSYRKAADQGEVMAQFNLG